MKELSLFTGAGGGVLGTKLLGWTTIGYVEYEPYCQQIIRQRIEDGILDAAPIFGDIRAFVQDGHAGAYQGMVDVVTAGFPCQPFSVAGKRQGADDERNMWPATLAVIREVRPRYCMLENVPGLVVSGYFGTILGGLAESGYDCRWRILSAAEMGAPHKRDRLWIVAYPKGYLRGTSGHDRPKSLDRSSSMADTESERESGIDAPSESGERSGQMHTITVDTPSRLEWWDTDPADVPDASGRGQPVRGRASGSGRHLIREGVQAERQESEPTGPTEPELGRVAYGVANRVDRLKAIGNGQVPTVAALAWTLLTEGMDI